MYDCSECEKQFNSKQSLGGHKSVHKVGPRYSVSRKKTEKSIINCGFCNNPTIDNYDNSKKFCSRKCASAFKWAQSKSTIESGIPQSANKMRKYLVEITESCTLCGQGKIWNNIPLTLQLDHIDGNSDNNNLTNLRIVCPNCHTQTPTFGNKGIGNRYKKITKRNTWLRKYKNSN